MIWPLRTLVRWLLGPAAVEGITDDMLNGLELAIQEEAARMGVHDPRDMRYYGAGPSAPWWVDDDIAEGLPLA